MTFAIDTAPAVENRTFQIDRVQALLDAVRDELGENATQEQIDGKLAEYITGELRAPKTVKTSRRHFIQYFPLIAPLADREPDLFDALILELAELVS